MKNEEYLINADCYFSLSLDFLCFYNSVCLHILFHKLHLSMRRKSAQCKTEELFLCTAVSNSVRDLE